MRFVYLGGVVKYVTGAGDVFVTNLTPPPPERIIWFSYLLQTPEKHTTREQTRISLKNTHHSTREHTRKSLKNTHHTWTHKKIIVKHTPHVNTQENDWKTHHTWTHKKIIEKHTPHKNTREKSLNISIDCCELFPNGRMCLNGDDDDDDDYYYYDETCISSLLIHWDKHTIWYVDDM